MTVDAAILDTELYAPLPRGLRQAWAEGRRPGVRILQTPGSLVRVRDTGGGTGGPTVVLVSDAPHTVESYDGLFAELGPHVRLIVLEPPGFGFSWASDPAGLSFTGATAAIVDALGQLEVTAAVLGGACVYGFLALAVAAIDPSLARSLLLAQTPSWEASVRWGRDTLDPRGQLSVPWQGQVGWRMVREDAAQSWYRPRRTAIALATNRTGDPASRGVLRLGLPSPELVDRECHWSVAGGPAGDSAVG